MTQRVYFDNAATTPLDPRVAQAMQPYLRDSHGNPSSLHQEGREAREAVEQARRQVSRLVNADPGEIVFTASGTEADNMALEGVVFAAGLRNAHIITSAIEHPAVMACCRHLERLGVGLTVLPVSPTGLVDPADLQRALRPETRLVSIMAANNVIGTLEPIDELSRITKGHGAVFHTDAVQMAGRLRLDVQQTPVDLVSMSAHKLHGPKGIGALYIRCGVKLVPLVHGGGQENDRRSGTENVAGIVGFGVAAELATENLADETARLVNLRDQLIDSILETIPNAYLIGERFRRLPGHVCLGFAGMEGEAIKLLLALDEAGIAVASGSACSSHHAGEPSHVLTALGFDPLKARGSLRITLGRFSTRYEVERFVEILPRAVQSLRSMAPLPSTA